MPRQVAVGAGYGIYKAKENGLMFELAGAAILMVSATLATVMVVYGK